jgi:hypothetical protein
MSSFTGSIVLDGVWEPERVTAHNSTVTWDVTIAAVAIHGITFQSSDGGLRRFAQLLIDAEDQASALRGTRRESTT